MYELGIILMFIFAFGWPVAVIIICAEAYYGEQDDWKLRNGMSKRKFKKRYSKETKYD